MQWVFFIALALHVRIGCVTSPHGTLIVLILVLRIESFDSSHL